MELVSVSEAAGIKGCSKQNISKRVARLQEQGLIATQKRGRETVFSLAEYDTVTGEVTDPSRLRAQQTTREIAGRAPTIEDEIAGNLSGSKAKADPTYTEELSRKVRFEGDLKEIEVRKQRGELLETDDVRHAMERCAERLVRDIEHITARADDLASAVGRNGAAGAREFLKGLARELRETLARSMTLTAGEDESEDEGLAQ